MPGLRRRLLPLRLLRLGLKAALTESAALFQRGQLTANERDASIDVQIPR